MNLETTAYTLQKHSHMPQLIPRPVLLQKIMQRVQNGGHIEKEFSIINKRPKI